MRPYLNKRVWIPNRSEVAYRCLCRMTSDITLQTVAVLRWGQGAQAPQILPRPPKILDTVVLLLVELIGSIVNFA